MTTTAVVASVATSHSNDNFYNVTDRRKITTLTKIFKNQHLYFSGSFAVQNGLDSLPLIFSSTCSPSTLECAQRDSRPAKYSHPAEYRSRPLFNAAKFG